MGDIADTHTNNGTGRDSGGLLSMLRASILSGEVSPGEFLPTVRQLGEKHGVSRGTAWRALKALVAEGLVAAQPRHGYRVLARAGDPALGAPLAYVISQENIIGGWDLYYRKLSAALEESARERGWSLVTMITGWGQENVLFEQLEASRVCGLILDSVNPGVLARARKAGLLVVMADAWEPGVQFDAVVQDDFGGGELAAEHLLEIGCRRIAWFGPVGQSHHGRARYGGARAALAAQEKGFSHEITVDLDSTELLERAEGLLEGARRPDGVLAMWRPPAAAVTAAARRLDLEIGQDVHMVGWAAEEVYEEGFLPLFEGRGASPAVVWSARTMAESALSRLAERRAKLNLPTIRMTVPTRLRLPR